MLMPDAAIDEAIAIAERVRRAVATLRVEGGHRGVTVSIGVASAKGQGLSIDALLRDADMQLYAAKNAGRNRIGSVAKPVSQPDLSSLRRLAG